MFEKMFEIITGEKIRKKQEVDIVLYCAIGLISGFVALMIAFLSLAISLMLIGYSIGCFWFAAKTAYENDMLF